MTAWLADKAKTSEWSASCLGTHPRRSSCLTVMPRCPNSAVCGWLAVSSMSGWPLRRAAERFQVSATTAERWAGRYRQLGEAGMVDRSSRPHRSPRRTPTRTERRIIKVRVTRRWGPARIGYLLGSASLDGASGAGPLPPGSPGLARPRDGPGDPPLRTRPSRRSGAPGRQEARQDPRRRRLAHPRPRGPTTTPQSRAVGYHYLHSALDDHSRLTYSELLPDELGDTAAAFWLEPRPGSPATASPPAACLTDNGSCYRSRAFAAALGPVTHKRTRPYRPQTNGKIERFHRTLADEWAYARPYRSDTERCDAFTTWLHTYNHHRGHTALAGLPPASRVPNLSGQYT